MFVCLCMAMCVSVDVPRSAPGRPAVVFASAWPTAAAATTAVPPFAVSAPVAVSLTVAISVSASVTTAAIPRTISTAPVATAPASMAAAPTAAAVTAVASTTTTATAALFHPRVFVPPALVLSLAPSRLSARNLIVRHSSLHIIVPTATTAAGLRRRRGVHLLWPGELRHRELPLVQENALRRVGSLLSARILGGEVIRKRNPPRTSFLYDPFDLSKA